MGSKNMLLIGVVLFGVASVLSKTFGMPHKETNHGFLRSSRASKLDNDADFRVIDNEKECFLVSADPGDYFFESTSSEDKVCGLFLISRPDTNIILQFHHLDVPCHSGGLVAWIDGWELNGQTWPPMDEVNSEDRLFETCGTVTPKKLFLSSQNAALLQYRVPHLGKGFAVTVAHVPNPNPCNQLVYGSSGVYTINNYGNAGNCTLLSLSPAVVTVLDYDVAQANTPQFGLKSANSLECEAYGTVDHLEIGGINGIDTNKIITLEKINGLHPNSGSRPLAVACESTVVRHVSCGQVKTRVIIAFQPLSDNDILTADLVCPFDHLRGII